MLDSPMKKPPSDQFRQVMTVSSSTIPTEVPSSPPKRRRIGRPPGSKNKLKNVALAALAAPVAVMTSTQFDSQPSQATKRRPGRPLGSKNKRKRTAEDEFSTKRARLSPSMTPDSLPLSKLPFTMTSAFDPASSKTAIEALFRDLNQMACNMSTIFARPQTQETPASRVAEPTKPAQAAPLPRPETPRRSRTTTPHTSAHFTTPTGVSSIRSPSKRTPLRSGHFSPRKTPGASSLPFPPLKARTFGLIQEELASDPFHVLLATTLLTKTAGSAAIPIIRSLVAQYPTAESIASASPEDLFPDIKHLGLGSRRAQALIELAKAWVAHPPEKGKRHKRVNYPHKGAGKDILPREEPLGDEDGREAYEVGHLPHVGPYGIDSWRIFCRDGLRGVQEGLRKGALKGKEEACEVERAQEWTRVRPGDKELRAYVKWRWLRLGVDWDPETGEGREVDRAVLKKMQKGRLDGYEGFESPWKGV